MPAASPASSTSASTPTRARRSRRSIACRPRCSSKPRSSSSSASLSTASRSWSSRPTSPRSAWTRRPTFAPPKPAWYPAARDPRAERRPGGPALGDPRAHRAGADRRQHRAAGGPRDRVADPSGPQPHAHAGSFLPAYDLGPVAMSLFAGVLADRWGTAKMLVLGQALIAAGLLAASAAPSYTVFIALMVAAGVGYGTLNPASTTAAMSWFPPRRRATVVGLKQVGLPFGGMLGAAIVPMLALRLGWRRAFGVLSDRTFGGRRRTPLTIASCGSTLCSIAIAFTGPASPARWLVPLAVVFGFFGIGWNGVQHTLMAELAGPRAATTAVGLGLAVSSLGVTLGPPVFGACVEWAGGYRGPWIGLALVMLAGLALLAL